MNKRIEYLIGLALFKLLVGIILLQVSWSSMSWSDNKILSLVIICSLSFIPAAFSQKLFNFLNKKEISRFSNTYFLAFIPLIYLIQAPDTPIIFKFLANFLIWIGIFLIENIMETIFYILSKDMKQEEKTKLNSQSTMVTHACTLTGPLTLPLLNAINITALPYFLMMIISLVAFFFVKSDINISKRTTDTQITCFSLKKNIHAILFIALTWGTLTIINILIPYIGNQFSSISVMVSLEIAFVGGMLFAGSVFTKIANYINTNLNTMAILLTIVALGLSFSHKSMYLTLPLFFTLGTIFGLFRMLYRMDLSKSFQPEISSQIFIMGNAISAPIVALYALLFGMSSTINLGDFVEFIWILPFSFLIFSLNYCYFKKGLIYG